jgi:hypothetical protein
MKKMFMILFCMMILPVFALAEEVAPLVDVTDVVIAALVLVLVTAAAVARYVWRGWVRPWLEKRELTWLTAYADEAVMLAEAFIGRGLGSEKWKYALAKMAEYGFAVDSTAVTDALLAAWKRLDLLQIDAGEKKPSNNNTGGDADA